MRSAIILATALALAGCATTPAWVDNIAAQAVKAKSLAVTYCKIRPDTSLDDMALAAIALATSEKAADTIKAGATKICEWVGVPEVKQAAE